MIQNLKEILIRLFVVIVFLLFTIWQIVLFIIKLIGTILYNISDSIPLRVFHGMKQKLYLKI